MHIIVRTSLCAAIAACATTILAAQTTSSPQTNTSSTDQKTVVVTGCLKEAPPSSTPAAVGTTGTTGDAAPAPKYVLSNATTSGSVASSGAATYRLIANMSALTPHVGKKLELTGVLEEQSSAAPGSETAGGADVNPNSPTLRVQSGKIVAASCSE